MKLIPALFFIFLLSSCASSRFYEKVQEGEFSASRPKIEWSNPKIFNYRYKDNPNFSFTRHNGEVIIIPEDFQTNGGSVPRILWARKGYSPWTYLRSYLIHDWIYEANARNLPSAVNKDRIPITYTREQADWILAEALKTEMEEYPEYRSPVRLKALHWGVDRFGLDAWNAAPTTADSLSLIQQAPFLRTVFYILQEGASIPDQSDMEGAPMKR